jgi:hypothetical protein
LARYCSVGYRGKPLTSARIPVLGFWVSCKFHFIIARLRGGKGNYDVSNNFRILNALTYDSCPR